MSVKNKTNSAREPKKNPNEKKVVRSLSVTDTAWDAIKEKADAEGVSASEFIERVGRDASVLETPLNSRLKGFLEPPIPIFWSISEVIRRFAVQLSFVESSSERGLRKDEIEDRVLKQKDIVRNYLWRAMLIIAIINYGIPKLDVNSITSLLRWISFKMMVSEAPKPKKSTSENEVFISEQQIERDIKNIQISLKVLQKFSVSYYEILDMIMNGKMSYAQIAKYKRLHTQRHFTEAEIRREVKQATYQLRFYFHKEIVEVENDKESNTLDSEESVNMLQEYKMRYYQLCSLAYLQKKDKENVEEILYRCLIEPELEFWIREIDHLAGHHLGSSESAHINLEYKDIHYELREELQKKIKDGEEEDSLQNQLTEMNKKLMFCKSSQEIENIVNKLVIEISGETLQLNDIKPMMK
ncbi:hypothetical protein [Nostoc sp. CALU 1950]|uniref:hypothetical protein n=1 Tax=Nostoc sp. CALU 1950 TaxID=3104321 RepID=UPI003EBF34B2